MKLVMTVWLALLFLMLLCRWVQAQARHQEVRHQQQHQGTQGRPHGLLPCTPLGPQQQMQLLERVQGWGQEQGQGQGQVLGLQPRPYGQRQQRQAQGQGQSQGQGQE